MHLRIQLKFCRQRLDAGGVLFLKKAEENRRCVR